MYVCMYMSIYIYIFFFLYVYAVVFENGVLFCDLVVR